MKKSCTQLFIIWLISLFFTLSAHAQFSGGDIFNEIDNDVEVGGDIFNDFNEDLDASQVLEDERFYRYGRFFAVGLGLGLTDFTGNRGAAYDSNPPAYTFHLNYFFSFRSSFILGLQFSKHTMDIATAVNGFKNEILGFVETTFLRPFMGFRYYFDTTDLGTAITYSNPYLVTRFEYWYQKNKFPERDNVPDQSGGGIGISLGFGLEFPIELKETYIGVEFLFHEVNYFDRLTNDYRQIEVSDGDTDVIDADNNGVIDQGDSSYGFDNLEGFAYSIMVTYNITW